VAAGFANLVTDDELGEHFASLGVGAASAAFIQRHGQQAQAAAAAKVAADAAGYALLCDNADSQALLVSTFDAEQEAKVNKEVNKEANKRKALLVSTFGAEQEAMKIMKLNKEGKGKRKAQAELARLQEHQGRCESALRLLKGGASDIPLEDLIKEDKRRIGELEAAMEQPPGGSEVTATSAAAPVTPTAAPVNHLTPAQTSHSAPSSAPCLVS
jgi:hypothetical protein